MKPPLEVLTYYERFQEESRLGSGPPQLEFERTKAILERVLPKPPARIIDVGGAAGAYSAWLAGRGYEVHLVDASPRLVQEARKLNAGLARPIASLSIGDARALPQADGIAAAVLVMGPLYHLLSVAERVAALGEARRVLVPSGVVLAAAVSRYASALDGLARQLTVDPAFVRMRDRDLRDGQHRNETDRPDYFTTAYFHRPEDLRAELEAAGFTDVGVLGVEGPGWMVSDFESRWTDEAFRADIMNVARALESEPSIVGASAHLLGIARKPGVFTFSVVPIGSTRIPDGDLEALLRLVYVGGGFTEASLADSLFLSANVRARGEVLVAQDSRGDLVGMVVAVSSGSPACRFAKPGEAELHLLGVHPEKQGYGVGSALVEAAIDVARKAGATRMILWTQPSMIVAQRLYVKHGFERVPGLDFSRGERSFQVFARPIVVRR